MGIYNGEKDYTPDWDEQLQKLTGEQSELTEQDEKVEQEKSDELDEYVISESEKSELITEINYDILLEEEDKAFRLFQKMYVVKKNIIKTLIFVAIACVFGVQLASGKGDEITWGLLAVCVGFIAVIWISPIRIRKFLMSALEALKDDKYVFRLYEKGFEIETIIPNEDIQIAKDIDSESDSDSENAEKLSDEDIEKRLKPPISKYDFSDEKLRLVETDDMYLIFVGKETFHVLPKRCLSDTQMQILSDSFVTRFGDYTKRT